MGLDHGVKAWDEGMGLRYGSKLWVKGMGLDHGLVRGENCFLCLFFSGYITQKQILFGLPS